MAKLTAPNGASVSVADDKVDGLLLRGFAKDSGTTKAPAKKAASPRKSASAGDK